MSDEPTSSADIPDPRTAPRPAATVRPPHTADSAAPEPVPRHPAVEPALPQGRYPSIAEHAIIGDTRTCALIARDGSLDWLCLPNFDGPSLCAGLLDADRGGRLDVRMVGARHVERAYRDGSAVLETRHEGPDGVVRVTDALLFATEGRRRPLEPARRLVRLVEVERGTVDIDVLFQPRPDYGRRLPRLRRRGRSGWVMGHGGEFVLFQTDLEVDLGGTGMLAGRTRLAEGDRRTVSLSFSRGEIGVIPQLGDAAREACEATLTSWHAWTGKIAYDGPFRDAVVRSLITLRLLSFSQSGAVIAAPTTSLPEAIGGTRNWDYRYCWLRDASFILRSFLSLGFGEEGEGFFRWLMHATQLTAPRLSILYSIYGRTHLPEAVVPSLEGFRASGPVRIGNEARTQLQLDVYGAVLSAALHFVRSGYHLGRSEQRRIVRFGEVVLQDWTLPDNGIWEVRDQRQHNTYSKAMCFAALDALVQLCEMGAVCADVDRFVRERDAIKAAILQHAWSPERQAFVGAFGQHELDASLLLLPRIGLLPPDDPRMVATFERIDEELGRGARIYRYRPGIDGFPSIEGTFTACGFWAAEYLALRGEPQAARRRIEALLADANDLGLMSEETDPATGQMLGNFPQAFSHAGLISAALAVRNAETGRHRPTPQ